MVNPIIIYGKKSQTLFKVRLNKRPVINPIIIVYGKKGQTLFKVRLNSGPVINPIIIASNKKVRFNLRALVYPIKQQVQLLSRKKSIWFPKKVRFWVRSNLILGENFYAILFSSRKARGS